MIKHKIPGSYILIKRDIEYKYGDDIFAGIVYNCSDKYKHLFNNIESSLTKVLYFSFDVLGHIIIDKIEYDVVLYYKIINVIFDIKKEEEESRNPLKGIYIV